MSASKDDFKPGDVVETKGIVGPDMLVLTVYGEDPGPYAASVIWFAVDDTLQRAHFNFDSLQLVAR